MGLSSFNEVKTHMCLIGFVILPSHLDMIGKTLGTFSPAVSIKNRTVFKNIEWMLIMLEQLKEGREHLSKPLMM